jgi:hypothetical protein
VTRKVASLDAPLPKTRRQHGQRHSGIQDPLFN